MPRSFAPRALFVGRSAASVIVTSFTLHFAPRGFNLTNFLFTINVRYDDTTRLSPRSYLRALLRNDEVRNPATNESTAVTNLRRLRIVLNGVRSMEGQAPLTEEEVTQLISRPGFGTSNLSELLRAGGGGVAPVSVSCSDVVIRRFPVVKFSDCESSTTPTCNLSSDRTACCICMNDYQNDDNLKILPCLHRFHEDCVNTWLKKKGLCPICKVDVRKSSCCIAEDE